MKILFDQGAPAPLRRSLPGHDVSTAYELGWQALKNGDLLQRAMDAGFAALVTTDQNLRYQQNLKGRPAVVVLMSTNWPLIREHADRVAAGIATQAADAYVEIQFPVRTSLQRSD